MSASDDLLDQGQGQVGLEVLGLTDFDPAALEHVVVGAHLEHRRLKGGGSELNVLQCTLPHSVINRGAYSPAVLANGIFSQNTIAIGAMLRQQQPTIVNGRESITGTVQVYPENSELCYRSWPEGTWHAFVISRERLLEFCLEHVGFSPKLSNTSITHIEPTSDIVGARLLESLRDLDRSLRSLSKGANAIRLGESVERDLLARYSSVICGHSSIRRDSDRRRLRHCREMFREAMDLVAQDESEMFDLQSLSRATGLSPRTLQRTFQAELGLCPQEWFRIERLNRVHDDLLNGSHVESVTQIATRWGFFHLGRFAYYYRDLFGETPSETLRSRRGIFSQGNFSNPLAMRR
jgi:AraC-like DNA-binding protein